MTREFFDESREQSEAKAAIVSKYFDAWAKVISRRQHVDRIAYVDLFSGPGRYKDGTASTPLLVLEKATADDTLSQKLVCVFNDVDSTNTRSLEEAINSLPNIDRLKHKPTVLNTEVGSEMVRFFESRATIPSLVFVDPWGYKGLSIELVNAVVKNWACECIFFFNYNRINMGLSNVIVRGHMNALFGEDRADQLRLATTSLSPVQREMMIVEELCKALEPGPQRFVLPFAFKSEAGTRTSHHLIFVSKNILGYTIMKEVMARESSSSQQGVANFAYSPADNRQPFLFEFARPLDELGSRLLEAFAGRSLKAKEVYERHHVGTPFIKKNYQKAIISLEENREVATDRTETQRKRGHCPFDRVTVTFPRRGNG